MKAGKAVLRVGQDERSGADELRLIVQNMDICRESFNDRFSAEELVQIGRMLLASEWDIYPDCWTERQIKEALKGKPPKWDDNEKPVYEPRKNRGQR